jgi:hypothetical protein
MDNSRKIEFIKSGCLFVFIPIIATYLLGHAFKFLFSDTVQSAAEMPVEDPDRMFLPQIEIVFPFAILSGCVAFFVWTALMYKKASTVRGICAGILTVFSCYPILGFAMGWFYPDLAVTGRLGSAISASFSFTLFGNIMSFWLTYPLGGLCGWLIAKKFISTNSLTDADIFS